MTEATTEPKPPLTADEKRAATGVTIVAINLHNYLARKEVIDRKRVLGDVAFLQEALSKWPDVTHFGKITKQLAEAAIAEAATDKRLTGKK